MRERERELAEKKSKRVRVDREKRRYSFLQISGRNISRPSDLIENLAGGYAVAARAQNYLNSFVMSTRAIGFRYVGYIGNDRAQIFLEIVSRKHRN